MADQLRFDGRVVVITGAGAGLGREYALLFGERGASVVVNDLGGSRHGDGSSTKAADAVVEEIRRKGGKAVANYDSVEDGGKVIKTAIDNFGRVDIVVNNAGILRDKSVANMSDTDWDLVHRVHLKSSFKVTQAAWPYFRKQKYGKVIMTASNSGIYGNFGQANYSAAKLGLVGLCNTLAIEGKKNNIHCNVLVPTAASRLTEDVMPPDMFAQLKPEFIAPVVVWLCHESCQDSGTIIDSALGWAGKYHIVRSPGAFFRKSMNERVTPEAVREKWQEITDMSNAKHYDNIQESTAALMQSYESFSNKPAGQKAIENIFTYTDKDSILYALGVGATVTNPNHLKYLYENHEDFTVLPTYGILPGQILTMYNNLTEGAVPGKQIDLARVLHGEQYLELFKPLPPSCTVRNVAYITDVLDKGSGAVVIVNVDTFDQSGEKLAFAQMTIFAVGAGKFGGKRSSDKAIPSVDPPSRSPDAVVSEQTSRNQAAIYRLSGDYNPLHIDPNMAALGGFDTPILHGLCSLGFSARHVLEKFGNNDPSNFKCIKVRFSKPVIPGQTLQTNMWKEGNRIHFQTKVVENGTTVITGAYIDLHKVSSTSKPSVSLSGDSLKSEGIFQAMKERMYGNMQKVKQINAIFLYNITRNGSKAGSWTVDLKKGELYKGDPQGTKADCTLTMEDDVLVELVEGKLKPQAAFMQGKLKLSGNIMLAQKLQTLMRDEAKL